MIVKIRFRYGPRVGRTGRKNRHLALATAALLTPAALTACALASWRLAADLRLAGQFAISNGLFSHWQVWFAVAILTQLASILLNRYGGGHAVVPASEEQPAKTVFDPGF